jgi:hypothetical protein
VATKKGEVEITRSYSYELGQPNYSSVDFFCSITDKCMREDRARVSTVLADFAKSEVRKSIIDFLGAQAAKEKAERDAEREKAVASQNKKAAAIEAKDEAKESAEFDAGTSSQE